MIQSDIIRDESEKGGLRAHKHHAEGLDRILETINYHRIILSYGMRCYIFILDRKFQLLGEIGI